MDLLFRTYGDCIGKSEGREQRKKARGEGLIGLSVRLTEQPVFEKQKCLV